MRRSVSVSNETDGTTEKRNQPQEVSQRSHKYLQDVLPPKGPAHRN